MTAVWRAIRHPRPSPQTLFRIIPVTLILVLLDQYLTTGSLNLYEAAVIVFVEITALTWVTAWRCRKLSNAYPAIRSLAERKRVSYAVMWETSIISMLAINSRLHLFDLPRDLTTLLLVLALTVAPWVNSRWLALGEPD